MDRTALSFILVAALLLVAASFRRIRAFIGTAVDDLAEATGPLSVLWRMIVIVWATSVAILLGATFVGIILTLARGLVP